jgi:hypothetical protein
MNDFVIMAYFILRNLFLVGQSKVLLHFLHSLQVLDGGLSCAYETQNQKKLHI